MDHAFDHYQKIFEEAGPTLNLYKRLERVCNSAYDIWDDPRLLWFTNHQAQLHSEHVITHIGSIIKNLQNTQQKLTPHELYVLFSACYLHDIGMQDFRVDNERSVEDFNSKDYLRIRENHPRSSKELIIKCTQDRELDDFYVGLDPQQDQQYLLPIALVSEGHGSAFFNQSVQELNLLDPHPDNKPLRGSLLTALLLMGDELDLHENRATFLQEYAQSPESLLHHYINHYITSVRVVSGKTPKHRRICLKIRYPENSEDYRIDVRDWVTTKLYKQCQITNPLLEINTEGELSWENQIEIHESIDHHKIKRSFSESSKSRLAMYKLKCEVLEKQIVDRGELREAIKTGLSQSKNGFQAIQIINQDDSDWCHLAKWFEAICDYGQVNLIHIAFHHSIAHGPFDILNLLSDVFNKTDYNPSEYRALISNVKDNDSDVGILNALGLALLNDLNVMSNGSTYAIILEDADKAEENTARWLDDWFLPKLMNMNIKLLVILTQSNEEALKKSSLKMQTFRLTAFTEDQIAEHVKIRFGYSPQSAENIAKKICTFSAGTPLNVIVGLKEMEEKHILVKGSE